MIELKFDDKGLIPAIVQDIHSKKVLMLAYMNDESLRKTMATGTTWFFSRSRQELWHKGETSGNIQHVKKVSYDCDGDALLIEVDQQGVACHTGNYSCFYREILNHLNEDEDIRNILIKLAETIKDRKLNPKEGSYTNYLFENGIDKILKKVGEESAEIIIAAKNPSKDELVYEICDFVYHLMVLMEIRDVSTEDIRRELSKRYK
jgi:phosphoribosyl-ATP pyrophosphohydrolase/phosphoribosyl-AMP cyclohydrolase